MPADTGNGVKLNLRALLYREDNWWIAHCLELDIVAQGKSPVEAYLNLVELADYQIEEAVESGDVAGIFRQAPGEVMLMFQRGKEFDVESVIEDRSHPELRRIDRLEARELAVA